MAGVRFDPMLEICLDRMRIGKVICQEEAFPGNFGLDPNRLRV
jgi:hypothetical protein